MKDSSRKYRLIIALIVVCFGGCASGEPSHPTPEAAKEFLKLRGYQFDKPSFFRAASAGDVIAVNGFLAAGMNPNEKNEDDDTVLTAAAARGDAKIVSAMLKGGADVNVKGRNTWTALLLALKEERHEAADVLLLQPNLDVKAETPEGSTALMLAVWHHRADAVRTLIQKGSDVNHQDKDRDAPLHGAAWYGNMQILGALLEAKANPNVKNKLGGTPLMWAAAYGQDAAVRLLLEKGADPRTKDNDGVTAAGWAGKNGRSNLVLVLKDAEKTAGSKQ
jgi:ankyrin repeat protein